MYLKWGGGKGIGSERGGGPTRDLSGRESHHNAKEGFQGSKRELWNGAEISKQRGLSKGLGYALRYHANLVHIVLIVYMSC